ncbi:MAG: LexA family transcriptional regulator [Pseudolactococcus laudensis]
MATQIAFPEMVKHFRLQKNLTMEELAKKLGKAKSSISKWESGERSPKIYEIEEIAEFFGVEPNVMMFGFGKVKSTSTTKQILDSVFSKLEEPRQDKVVAYAKSELDEQNKVVEIAGYQIEKEYPYYDDAVSAGTGQYIGTSQRETITLPVEFDADYVVPVYGDSMEPEYHDGDYIFIESTVNLNDGEIGVFELYGDTYVKQLILEDDHACLHSFNEKYKDMKVDADSDFRVLGRVVGRYNEN